MSIDAYLLIEQSAKFHADPICNDKALRFFRRALYLNKKNKKNQMSGDNEFEEFLIQKQPLNRCNSQPIWE